MTGIYVYSILLFLKCHKNKHFLENDVSFKSKPISGTFEIVIEQF